MPRTCPSCGKWAKSEWWVCPKCGQKLLDGDDGFGAGPEVRRPYTRLRRTLLALAVIAVVGGAVVFAVPHVSHLLAPLAADTPLGTSSSPALPRTGAVTSVPGPSATSSPAAPDYAAVTSTDTTAGATAGATTADDVTPAQLVRVVDGDTIVVKLAGGKQERVALIGIDAPESGKKGSEQATDCITRLLATGPIGLELDKVTRDKYKRLLAYVHVGDLFVNEELVREGHARARSSGENRKYAQLLADAQRYAQESHAGMWGRSTIE